MRGLLFSFIILFTFCFTNSYCGKYPSKTYEEVLPYLLPDDHPIKNDLDKLFSKTRLTFNRKTLKEAGFLNNEPREFTSLIVTTHPKFPGYIFKLYLDIQRYQHRISEATFWISRIEGAAKVRQAIKDHRLEALLKVPQKWIYLLPSCHKIPEGYYPRYTILVEENMNLVSKQENKALWASDNFSTITLDAIYLVLTEAGLSDCAKIENIPFSKDGKIAFIDTQAHGKPVPYKRLNNVLSAGNKKYWKSLITKARIY